MDGSKEKVESVCIVRREREKETEEKNSSRSDKGQEQSEEGRE